MRKNSPQTQEEARIESVCVATLSVAGGATGGLVHRLGAVDQSLEGFLLKDSRRWTTPLQFVPIK
jgi:hypothetical protein